MTRRKFLRRDWYKISKLGRRRKKKQVWRRAKGRDSKIRLKEKGYSSMPSISYKKAKEKRGLMAGLRHVLINNISDLANLKSNEIGIIGKIGKKKKIEIAKKAIEKSIKLSNLEPKSFLAKIEQEKALVNREKRDEKEVKAEEKKEEKPEKK